MKRDPVYRVIASDKDQGPNSEISYTIEEGDEHGKFFIEPKTGLVSSKKFSSAGEYDILTVSMNAELHDVLSAAVLLSSASDYCAQHVVEESEERSKSNLSAHIVLVSKFRRKNLLQKQVSAVNHLSVNRVGCLYHEQSIC